MFREQAIREVGAIWEMRGDRIAYAVDQRERVLELEAALRPLLEEHCCDDGSPDYNGTTRECTTCKPQAQQYGQCYKRHLWVIEVTWKRRKGKPVEVLGFTTGGMLFALFMAKGFAEKMKVPQSWVEPVLYERNPRKGDKP